MDPFINTNPPPTSKYDAPTAIPGMKTRPARRISADDDTKKKSLSENAKNDSQKVPDRMLCPGMNDEGPPIAQSDDDSRYKVLLPVIMSENTRLVTPGIERLPCSIEPPGVKSKAAFDPNPKNHPHFHALFYGEGAQPIHGEAEEVEIENETGRNAMVMADGLSVIKYRNHSDSKRIKRVLSRGDLFKTKKKKRSKRSNGRRKRRKQNK